MSITQATSAVIANGSITQSKLAADIIVFETGTVLPFATLTPPDGWLICNGDSLNTTMYSDLFGVIQYTFGGSGSSFNLPDIRGKFVRGYSTGTFGQTVAQTLRSHTHTASIGGTGAHNHTANRNAGSTPYMSSVGQRNDHVQGNSSFYLNNMNVRGARNINFGGTGSGHTHNVTINESTTGGEEVLPKHIPLLFCIKT